MRFLSIIFLLLISTPVAAEETVEELFEQGMALYPRCVLDEASRLDDQTEPAETVATAAMVSCREARNDRVELFTNFILYRTPEVPRTDEYRARVRDRADQQTREFDVLLRDRAILEVLEDRRTN